MAFQSIDPTGKEQAVVVQLPMSNNSKYSSKYSNLSLSIGRDKFCAHVVSWKANSHGNCWWPWRSYSKLTLYDYWFGGRKCICPKISLPSNHWGRVTQSEIDSHIKLWKSSYMHSFFVCVCVCFIWYSKIGLHRIEYS